MIPSIVEPGTGDRPGAPRNRRPNLKLMSKSMSTAELPVTMPAVVESSTQRLAWQRAIDDANDEIGLIDEQIGSVRRTADATRQEGRDICEARISAARRALERVDHDAGIVEAAGVEALHRRQADINKMVAGLQAALGASE